MEKIKILIADNNDTDARNLKDFLETQDEFLVENVIKNGDEVITEVMEKQPDILILELILPNIDAYFITPKIYKNTNRLSQTLTISSIIICSLLFGFIGIIIAIPLLIIIIEIIKYKKSLKINKNML